MTYVVGRHVVFLVDKEMILNLIWRGFFDTRRV